MIRFYWHQCHYQFSLLVWFFIDSLIDSWSILFNSSSSKMAEMREYLYSTHFNEVFLVREKMCEAEQNRIFTLSYQSVWYRPFLEFTVSPCWVKTWLSTLTWDGYLTDLYRQPLLSPLFVKWSHALDRFFLSNMTSFSRCPKRPTVHLQYVLVTKTSSGKYGVNMILDCWEQRRKYSDVIIER